MSDAPEFRKGRERDHAVVPICWYDTHFIHVTIVRDGMNQLAEIKQRFDVVVGVLARYGDFDSDIEATSNFIGADQLHPR